MNPELIATTSIIIHADPEVIWAALTDPAKVKQYFFGTDMHADWRVGGKITFSGEWEGKPYQDKGEIVRLEENQLLELTYWSNFSGMADIPENYAYVSYELAPGEIGSTVLTVTQTGFPDEAARSRAVANWETVLNNLKQLIDGHAS